MAPNSKGLGIFSFRQPLNFVFMPLVYVVIMFFVSRHNVCATSATTTNTSLTYFNTTESASLPITEIPLENIFPSNINARIQNSSGNGSGESVDPEELLRKALINHTLADGGEEDLDKLIFSNLPEGSKLILQTVKIIPTDEHGNPIGKSEKEIPVHWDVTLTNATDVEDENDEESKETEDISNSQDNKKSEVEENKSAVNDLIISGSHSQANYKAYGNSEKEKEKNKKYYHGTDHGKNYKVTNTDTDGVKDTKYHGKESGLTDSVNDHGKTQSNEHERYRDTKKKNKGRRVSGFKRVYHKEEFQRTEHFYDDEDAKRIAEIYGLKDKKEEASKGLKDDDRKYHGTRKEYTDGNKVRNEVGTSNGYKKGQLTEYKDSEKHKHASHYNKAQHSPNYNRNYQQHHHHPSHNYHGSYSQPKNTIRRPNQNYPLSKNKYSTSKGNNGLIVAELAKAPMTASFVVTEYQHDSSTDSSTDVPTVSFPNTQKKIKSASSSIPSSLEKPDEMKMFFSPRDRNSATDSSGERAPINNNNFVLHQTPRGQRYFVPNIPKHRNTFIRPSNSNPLTSFHNKIGNISFSDDESSRKNNISYHRNGNKSYELERYANHFPTSTVRNTIFGSTPEGYSTIVKIMPVKYINLTDGSRLKNDSRQQTQNSYQVASPGRETPSNVNHITFTTGKPTIIRRPPPRGNWISISIGNPDIVNDYGNQQDNKHPNHNYNGYMALRPITNLVRGVKKTLMNPILRPRFPKPTIYHIGGSRFDPSKYPPNVIAKSNADTNSQSSVPDNPQGGNAYRNVNLVTLNENSYSQHNQNPQISNQQSQPDNSYHQATSINQHQNGNIIPYSSVTAHRSRAPHTLPPFMNNLMDSVANFFSTVG